MTKSFLKWVGGKSKLIEQYQPYFPQQFETYYEPFLGGGSVFFYLKQLYPTMRAALSDSNEHLVNLYCYVRDYPEILIQLLDEHQFNHHQNPADYYYKIREEFRSTPKHWEAKRAAQFLYLNKTCYNGLYRENQKGQFNVPIGRYKNPRICDTETLRLASQLLQGVRIEVARFDRVLDLANDSKDFVYFDPPYHPISPTSNFAEYSQYGFKEAEQIELRDTFAELMQRGVKLMLSNSKCDFIEQLYKDDRVFSACPKLIDISASRNVNSEASKRGKIKEYLVIAEENNKVVVRYTMECFQKKLGTYRPV
ncbi:MAG: DNA adenine methylase [Richelia sp. CSU_2_1]|nr:DNA adenine methylase [Microcoleus sp. SU_5_3]NJR24521.1 DNA adenine methylase [Richelia sp. CSU_2_1]